MIEREDNKGLYQEVFFYYFYIQNGNSSDIPKTNALNSTNISVIKKDCNKLKNQGEAKSIHHINIESKNDKKNEENNNNSNLLGVSNPCDDIEISIPIDDVEYFNTLEETKNETKSKDMEESQLSEQSNGYLLKKRKIPGLITLSNQRDKKCHICKKECKINKSLLCSKTICNEVYCYSCVKKRHVNSL